MNKAYLEKLKEMLKNDNMSTIAGMNLSDNYIQVWSKSEGTEEDCPVLSVEQILSNKKNASEVADILINNYIQATYAFHHFGLDEYIPVMPIGINLLYRFNKQTIKENGEEKWQVLGLK